MILGTVHAISIIIPTCRWFVGRGAESIQILLPFGIAIFRKDKRWKTFTRRLQSKHRRVNADLIECDTCDPDALAAFICRRDEQHCTERAILHMQAAALAGRMKCLMRSMLTTDLKVGNYGIAAAEALAECLTNRKCAAKLILFFSSVECTVGDFGTVPSSVTLSSINSICRRCQEQNITCIALNTGPWKIDHERQVQGFVNLLWVPTSVRSGLDLLESVLQKAMTRKMSCANVSLAHFDWKKLQQLVSASPYHANLFSRIIREW